MCCGLRRLRQAALAGPTGRAERACLNSPQSLLRSGRARAGLLCRTLPVLRCLGVRSSSLRLGRGRWGRSRRCSFSGFTSMRRYFASARRAARSSPLSMASRNSLMMVLRSVGSFSDLLWGRIGVDRVLSDLDVGDFSPPSQPSPSTGEGVFECPHCPHPSRLPEGEGGLLAASPCPSGFPPARE